MEPVNYQQLYENLLRESAAKQDMMRAEHHKLLIDQQRRSEEMKDMMRTELHKQVYEQQRRSEDLNLQVMASTLSRDTKHTAEVAKLRLALEILDRMELPVEAQAVVQASLDRQKTC